MSVRQRWPDDVSTDLVPVRAAQEPVDESRRDIPLWTLKLLLIAVAVGVVAASVAVIVHMTDRSAADGPTAAAGGDCLTWPPGEPERAARVDCSDEHLFEVVGAASPDGQQACMQAVERSLGSRYEPNGRFVVGAASVSGQSMCGLQLPSNGVASVSFKGRVVDQDQSRVWPTGTCLGIRDGKTTDVAVECGLPHALEVTRTVDLSTHFGQSAPSTAAQDAVVREVCGAATSAYLAPVPLADTGLSVRYQPIDAAGWAAGSRKVACRIGAPKDGGGWATLVRSAKDGVVVDGRRGVALPAPAPEPPAPAEPAAAVEAAAPISETPAPSTAVEVPVRVNHETDESFTPAAPVPQMSGAQSPTAVPHLDGAEAPGPIPHMTGPTVPGPVPHMVGSVAPGPASGALPAERAADSATP
ncbi:hypothetical protein A5724_26185 [Mycobacterium sp. ACS1612]|uniref:septum formation family protein n=1 Tax=Mycobacterium sp. ACS1612 TaxID=1834117 RepID=UPI0008019A5F|nr:septum formation family protein [Mycobacterium sp. ACS1612]OBF28910.1 hypothetical protein A5724_26185 [Mycobacterium sp. ACS1612]